MRTARPLATLLITVLLLGAAQAGEEDVLTPTPAQSPDDVARTMAEHQIPEVTLTDEARAPEAKSLVGAVTGLRGGGLGFMPLLQHHMGVEHWFLEGLTTANLGRELGAGERLFVRLEGTVRLERQWSPFGGGTDFYGSGLPHGQVYGGPGGGVMGYHESVYRLKVESVTWVRTRAEFAARTAEYQRAQAALEGAIQTAWWSDALTAHERATGLAADVGVWRQEDLATPLQAILLFTGDPATWTDADVQAIADAFRKTFPSALQQTAFDAFGKVARTWAPATRDRLGPPLVAAWLDLGYRFQREAMHKNVLAPLGGEAVQRLDADFAEAEKAMADLKATFQAHLAAHAYADAQQVWATMQPLQAFLLTYEYADQQTQHWLPSLERCVALEAAFDDPAARMALLETQIREAVAAGRDLPNNAYRPRYPRELDEYFFPRLAPAERERIEALVVDLARALDPDEDWDDSLVAAELLAGVGSKAAEAFFPGFLARRTSRPAWQVEYHRTFGKRVQERARD